jgi:prepilin-type N-terminal cleavage/methylation domain-containing protein
MMRDGKKTGFTLVELIVVLAIVAVLVSISVPAIAAFASPKETLRKEGRKVVRLMNEARQAAMNRKVRIEIRIDPAMNELRAVESNAYRSLMASFPDGLVDREDEEWIAAMSNRFERVVSFGEEISLEGFPVEQIAAPFDDWKGTKLNMWRLPLPISVEATGVALHWASGKHRSISPQTS